ncbi:MAG: InlB B-repeat-containing protein [Clostridiales Family XIII bacterium]|nr:InlB B-repeat-containing protein [Clostridiales Family XIII bacterium]
MNRIVPTSMMSKKPFPRRKMPWGIAGRTVIPALLLALLLLTLPLCAVPPTEASALSYDKPPNGQNRLIDIFPDREVAWDISAQMGKRNLNYVPQGAAEFDRITTLSLPYSDVSSIYGIQYCRNLKNLYLEGNLLTDVHLEVFGDGPTHPKLAALELSGNDITSKGLPHLSGLPLTKLIARDTRITAENIEKLPGTLTVLRLSGAAIGDGGAQRVAKAYTHLTELELSANGIGDSGAAALAAMPGRAGMSLDLRNNRIGDSGLATLLAAGFGSLRLDGQNLFAVEVTNGEDPVVHHAPVGHIDTGSIWGGGQYDTASGTVTWPAARGDRLYEYRYVVGDVTGTVRVSVRYQAIPLTVTFVDGASKSAVQVPKGSPVGEPAEPVRTGSVFTGWSLAEGGGGAPYDFGAPVEESLTLHAGWTKNVEGRTALKAPTKFKVVRAGKASARLTWAKRAGASGYIIYRYDKAKKKYLRVKTTKIAATLRWTDRHLKPGTKQAYKIRAYRDEDGARTYSPYTKPRRVQL